MLFCILTSIIILQVIDDIVKTLLPIEKLDAESAVATAVSRNEINILTFVATAGSRWCKV